MKRYPSEWWTPPLKGPNWLDYLVTRKACPITWEGDEILSESLCFQVFFLIVAPFTNLGEENMRFTLSDATTDGRLGDRLEEDRESK